MVVFINPEREKLAYFGMIPLATFVCTFWLVVVKQVVLFAVLMLSSVVATAIFLRNREGTRIVIDDNSFKFGAFQRVSTRNISSVAIVQTTVGSNEVLKIGTHAGQEGETFNMKGVPDEIRAEILRVLESRLNAA